MDSFRVNKIIGAVPWHSDLHLRRPARWLRKIYEPEKPAKPGYVVEGVVESAGGGSAAPAEETMPDWGTVLASRRRRGGKTLIHQVRAVPRSDQGRPQQDRPNLFGVVDRVRASHEGFAYSSAMKGKPGNWTYDELFKFIKAPGVDIPGTKMSFAGLRSDKDRINLIAYLRTEPIAPAAIPRPSRGRSARAAPAAGRRTGCR
jgi:cytochrome c